MLNVLDFKTSEAFYDRILLPLGFEAEYREATVEWAVKSYRLNEHNLWIKHDVTSAPLPFVRNVGLDHLAFFVDSKDEVDRFYSDLKSIDVQITRAPSQYPEYSPSYYAFYFRDPDEIPLEIAFE